MSAGSDFKAGFSELLRRSRGRVDEVVRKVVIELDQSLILKSPVDTGRFRGNWQCGIGRVDLNTGSANDASGNSAKARTTQALSGWKAGMTIFLTNSLPYAQRLEYGWSKQAPAGMVRTTVVEYGQHLRKALEATA